MAPGYSFLMKQLIDSWISGTIPDSRPVPAAFVPSPAPVPSHSPNSREVSSYISLSGGLTWVCTKISQTALPLGNSVIFTFSSTLHTDIHVFHIWSHFESLKAKI